MKAINNLDPAFDRFDTFCQFHIYIIITTRWAIRRVDRNYNIILEYFYSKTDK